MFFGVVLRGWLRELTIYWPISARKMVKNCRKLQKSARNALILQEIGQKMRKIRKNSQKFARFFLRQGPAP